MKTSLFFLAMLLFHSSLLFSQVAINSDGSAPDSSAGLDVSFTNKGFLPPRLTLGQMSAIENPSEGLMVYCTTNEKVYIFVASTNTWKEVNFGTGIVSPPFNCGLPLTVTHTAGTVAPVNKTVSYGTVSNIPGESAKCWITSNLGSDHQALSVNDATEPSAGWYWQFNRKQGYKHDGTTRTPSGWVTSISENSDWIAAEDPCRLLLDTNWRITTHTELQNVCYAGNWATWTDTWNSSLKLHAAGMLNAPDGALYYRGTMGFYWSSTQSGTLAGLLQLSETWVTTGVYYQKMKGHSLRCLRNWLPVTLPTVTTNEISNITRNTATGGGNVTSEGGIFVQSRGICWNTSSNPTIADPHAYGGNGTGTFTCNMTGLTPGTLYYVRAYATNSVGTSYGNEVTFTTIPPWACGDTLMKSHNAGNVAPVTKSVTYGTITNIPGETSKCWITQNLGADHQADSVNDPTEPSAGWFWQFNRMQGYKHDGTTRTPSSWVTSISENSDWVTANDPCGLLLGTGWRIPTSTEWTNINSTGGWSNWSGPWGSDLKLHAAGNLGSDGALYNRGYWGSFWASTQYDNDMGYDIYFNAGESPTGVCWKNFGLSVRCLRE